MPLQMPMHPKEGKPSPLICQQEFAMNQFKWTERDPYLKNRVLIIFAINPSGRQNSFFITGARSIPRADGAATIPGTTKIRSSRFDVVGDLVELRRPCEVW